MSDFTEIIKLGVRAFDAGDERTYQNCIRLSSKVLRDLADAGNVDIALNHEPLWYNSLVKRVETESHYGNCFQWHPPSFWRQGLQHRSSYEEGRLPQRVGFMAHTGALLGHTEVMLRVLEQWKQAGSCIEPFFVALGAFQPQLSARLSQLGIPSTRSPKGLSPSLSVKWVRALFDRFRIGTAVWLSTPCMVSYAFAVGMAPKQVFWSLKFHGLHLGPTVTHVGMTKPRAGTIMINGAPWLAFSPPLALSELPRQPVKVAELRARWNGAFLFGTLAREEKFNSPDFISTLIRILKSTPDSHYIYTGRHRPGALFQALEQAGLQGRSTFVGWVDTNLYSQVVDVFLESFPFGCGVTGAQAVEHRTRMISLWAEDSLPRFYFSSIEEAQHFSPDWKVCGSTDEYAEAAVSAYVAGRRTLLHPFDREGVTTLKELDAGKADQLKDLFGLPLG